MKQFLSSNRMPLLLVMGMAAGTALAVDPVVSPVVFEQPLFLHELPDAENIIDEKPLCLNKGTGEVVVNCANAPAGPIGPTGPTGPTGLPGPPVVPGWTVVEKVEIKEFEALTTNLVVSQCPEPKRVLGGGCVSSEAEISIYRSAPDQTEHKLWVCSFYNPTDADLTEVNLKAYAICADVVLPTP